jgi:hypothetical protein
MDERDIEKLFASVLEESGQDTEAVRGVFSTLVCTTVRYRDEVLAARGEVVTVEDVRTCLGLLVPVLATGNMPRTDNTVRFGLLKLWVEELKKSFCPQVRMVS